MSNSNTKKEASTIMAYENPLIKPLRELPEKVLLHFHRRKKEVVLFQFSKKGTLCGTARCRFLVADAEEISIYDMGREFNMKTIPTTLKGWTGPMWDGRPTESDEGN